MFVIDVRNCCRYCCRYLPCNYYLRYNATVINTTGSAEPINSRQSCQARGSCPAPSSEYYQWHPHSPMPTLQCYSGRFHCLLHFAVEHLSDQEKEYFRNGKMYTTNQGCGHWFCGWCFKECVGGQDCHQHVKQCSVAPPHQRGGYHGTMPEFNQVHAAARRTKLLHYLQHNVPDEAEKSKLREVLAADLRDLGIKL